MPEKADSESPSGLDKLRRKISNEATEGANGDHSIKAETREAAEVDEFSLPTKTYKQPSTDSSDDDEPQFEDAVEASKMADNSPDETATQVEIADLQTEKAPELEIVPEKLTNGIRATATHARNFSSTSRIDDRPLNEQMVLPNPDSIAPVRASEWSHQQVVPQKEKDVQKEEENWQEMPAFAPFDLYDDDGKLVAREAPDSDVEEDTYAVLGGAGKGYTKVNLDEDAQSATSMDEDTKYLFKDPTTNFLEGEDEDQRDPLTQMQFSKHLLTEGQRIAYVGIVRLGTVAMIEAVENIPHTRGTKKEIGTTTEAMKMWAQKMMVRLYAHMEISSAGRIISRSQVHC
jgi:hypothetical protein